MAEIPINYLKYIDQDGTEKKVYPITVTDAVYDSDGNKLSNVLLGVLKDTDISNVQSDSTTTVPSSALLKATDDKIGDTSSLPGESSNVVSAITQLNSDMQSTSGKPTDTKYTNALNNLKKIWNSLDDIAFGNTVITTASDNINGMQVLVIYAKYADGNYGEGLFISYAYQRPMYVVVYNGVWNSPILL